MAMTARPHTLIALGIMLAASAGVSVLGLRYSKASADGSQDLSRQVQLQAQTISELSERIANLERQSLQRVVACPGLPASSAGQAPAESLAAQVADRLAEKKEAEQPQRTEDNVTAFDQGVKLIESAKRQGQWTERDSELVQSLIPRLYAEDHAELQRRLNAEINEGRIRLATREAVF